MKSNYNQLGQYIEMVSRTNSDLKYGIEDVRGCSNTKQMMQTRANLIGRTYEKFIVLRPQEFVFNRRTTRNGEKIGMAYNNTDREYIFTNDYVAFRVKQEYLDKLLPDYLYMFFCRDEFDRYARYKSTGSATEFFNWEDKINAIQLPNTKIKILQRLLSQAIDEFKKVNKIMGVEFADRLKKVVDEYNNRRRDEAYANEVLDDVAEQLAQLLSELKTEKNSFKNMGIDYEEKAFYDILKAVSKKFEFEYPDDKMIELSKRIKLIVDDKSRYTDWSARDDIKANLQVDLILLLDEFGYPPVTIDDVYKEVLEQAENFKKYAQ